jgi:putative ABC transport system substrate-binding protein
MISGLGWSGEKTPTTPVVSAMVTSTMYPAPNVTTISLTMPPHLLFSTMKRICPKAKKIGVIYDPQHTKEIIDTAMIAANNQNLELIPYQVSSIDDVYRAVRILGPKIHMYWIIPDATIYTQRSTQDLLLYSLREGIPTIGLSPTQVKAGALFTLSYNYDSVGIQAAETVLRILEGKSMPEGGYTNFLQTELSINLIVAERFYISVPSDVLKDAKNVYR